MEITEEKRKIENWIWEAGMQWDEYVKVLEGLLAEGKTTGPQQSEERLEHARINLMRMKRISQQFEPDEETMNIFASKPDGIKFLFIVEGWCGDAAQIVPALQKMVEKRGWRSKFILRDEFPAVMDMFLTNGSRSIPVAIALDEEGNVLQNHWGPRPALLLDMVNNWKKEMSKDDWHKLMHTWYAKDKSLTLQSDFAEWVKSL